MCDGEVSVGSPISIFIYNWKSCFEHDLLFVLQPCLLSHNHRSGQSLHFGLEVSWTLCSQFQHCGPRTKASGTRVWALEKPVYDFFASKTLWSCESWSKSNVHCTLRVWNWTLHVEGLQMRQTQCKLALSPLKATRDLLTSLFGYAFLDSTQVQVCGRLSRIHHQGASSYSEDGRRKACAGIVNVWPKVRACLAPWVWYCLVWASTMLCIRVLHI